MGTERETRIRLTKQVRQRILDQNEGFTDRTYYEGNNSREQRDYEIRGGELHVRARGKTSWADSRYDKEFVADDEQTRRFLRRHLDALNTDGLDSPIVPTAQPGRNGHLDSADNPDPEDVADATFYTDFEDDDFDEYDDSESDTVIPLLVAGALITVIVAVKLAPRVKRRWAESRAQRQRRRGQSEEPLIDAAGGDPDAGSAQP